ncbi:hypothetical protein [Calothrix sp. UHCC 0171]|uniref:hypothetical protein n=1 Tax=Calothrix sp. UHCC 0171 TaxID=3110245 RepID=UPI002B2158B0|nr:hypothetical protein [Calothrix sp. UHCC 0171]MEA5572787.1 hypothetical protein [Calothrix sp. UHCC 0171]
MQFNQSLYQQVIAISPAKRFKPPSHPLSSLVSEFQFPSQKLIVWGELPLKWELRTVLNNIFIKIKSSIP